MFVGKGQQRCMTQHTFGQQEELPQTLSGFFTIGVKTFLVLGKYHAVLHLFWAKVKVALDFVFG